MKFFKALVAILFIIQINWVSTETAPQNGLTYGYSCIWKICSRTLRIKSHPKKSIDNSVSLYENLIEKFMKSYSDKGYKYNIQSG